MQTGHMTQATAILKEYFGYRSFHPGQKSIIENLLSGRDVLGIMPTGAGKSICYQIPALLLPGLTIIISPLISLMKDQVDGLRRMGIAAALLNSSQTVQEMDETFDALRQGAVKLLYIAPERLEAEGFTPFLESLTVSMVAVDEAHCISQWGHDFRPSYRRIQSMLASFPVRPPVGAFTATATDQVRADIQTLLDLRTPYILSTGFDRENLYFAVHAPSDRDAFLLDYLRRNPGRSGIVYCITRKQVEKVAALLIRAGLSALPYHAGLPDGERRRNQDAFRDDRVDIIVATNAFGMGIDKSNVRFVLHYGMPKTVENYYQEAGRAGRDGEKADCILLFSPQDIMTNRFLIERSSDDTDKSGEYAKLQEMIAYCNRHSCLRAYILRYFGMQDVPETCGNCGNCGDDSEQVDITVEAQKIISCVRRMGNRFGSLLVAQVLHGADTKKIRQWNFHQLSTYGIMADYTQQAIKELIACLVARGILEVEEGGYPILVAGQAAMAFLREKRTLVIRRAVPVTATAENGAADPGLFETLRQLRKAIAAEQGVPPYQIFSDATLTEMSTVLPRNSAALGTISGVGTYKLEQYGEEFLFAIREYMDAHGIESPPLSAYAAPQKPSKKKTPGETAFQTYALYQRGLSLEEIAAERGLASSTVEGHLLAVWRQGKDVDLEKFIPPEHRDAIFAAIAQLGDDRLRPIKDALPEEVSFAAIRFAVEFYRRDTQNEMDEN